MGNLNSYGTIIAQIVGTIIGLFVCTFFLKKDLDYKQNLRYYLHYLYAGLSLGIGYIVFISGILDFLNGNILVKFGIIAIIAFSIYFLCAFASNLINKQDLVMILKLVNPINLSKMIIQELKITELDSNEWKEIEEEFKK